MYRDVHLLPCLRVFFVRAYLSKRWLYKTAMDGGGSTQQRVFRQKNSTLNSVHGRTLFNRLFVKALVRGGASALSLNKKQSSIVAIYLSKTSLCQSFIVRVSSSKELPMSTIFFPLAMYFAA